MTAGEEYFPVPTIRREENVLSAIVKRSTVYLQVSCFRVFVADVLRDHASATFHKLILYF